MYQTKHFSIRELVPPDVVGTLGDSPRLFMLFDCTALATLDMLRNRYGAVTVNDWSWGGGFRYSGWRPWDCPEGAALSQHKMGRAFDCKFADCTADEVRADIRANASLPAFAYIRRVEDIPDMSWFHFDTGNAGFSGSAPWGNTGFGSGFDSGAGFGSGSGFGSLPDVSSGAAFESDARSESESESGRESGPNVSGLNVSGPNESEHDASGSNVAEPPVLGSGVFGHILFIGGA